MMECQQNLLRAMTWGKNNISLLVTETDHFLADLTGKEQGFGPGMDHTSKQNAEIKFVSMPVFLSGRFTTIGYPCVSAAAISRGTDRFTQL